MEKNTAEKLYEAFYMKVFSFVMTLTGDRNDAMDITQETFLRAISSSKGFRGESECYTWLCAIAKNLFVDEKRHDSRHADNPPEDRADTKANIEKSLADSESALRIHRILHELEEPYKEVFQLRVFGELSFRQIGSIFGKTETWARVTHHRARLKIIERMDENAV